MAARQASSSSSSSGRGKGPNGNGAARTSTVSDEQRGTGMKRVVVETTKAVAQGNEEERTSKKPFPHMGEEEQTSKKPFHANHVPQRNFSNASSAQGSWQPRSPRKPVSERWRVAAWSKAGISTTVLVKDRTTRRTLMFDCGGMGGINPMQMAEADVVLVSHTHADHCAGLFAHARSRFAQQRPAKYLIPKDSTEQILQVRQGFEAMDEKELKMDIVEVSPGDIVNIGKGLFVECIQTVHRVPSVGFLIFREEKQIKEEYRNLSGEEKAQLGRSGARMTETVRSMEISYSGDTTAAGLDPRMFQAQLAIVECTFVEEKDRHLAEETQHVLLSDLEEVIERANPNSECQLLLMHFSARYSSSQITSAVRKASLLPKKTACALAAFQVDHHPDEDMGIFFA